MPYDDWTPIVELPSHIPMPLVAGIVHPERPTILHGAPSSGKGLASLWVALKAEQEGFTVLIADYERNEAEWGYRAKGIGVTKALYRWLSPAERLTKLADQIDSISRPLIILDSLTMAVETRSDNRGNNARSVALAMSELISLGCPILALAHIPKASEADVHIASPYGSMVYGAEARQIWSLIGLPSPEAKRIELMSMKNSDRADPPTLRLTFDFGPRGELSVSEEWVNQMERWDAVRRALLALGGAGTPRDVYAAILHMGMSVKNLSERNVKSWLLRESQLKQGRVFKTVTSAGGRGKESVYEWRN